MQDTRECTFTASNFRQDDFEHLVEALSAMGVGIDCQVSATGKTAKVRAVVPANLYDAKVKRTRLAGRRSQGINPPASSIFNSDTPCKEFLAWQKDHSAAEGMQQLGLSRATYFRRMKAMREKVAEYDRINASRDKSPEWKGKRRLVATLGSVR